MVKIPGDCEKVPLRQGFVGLYIHLLASMCVWGGGRGGWGGCEYWPRPSASSPKGQAQTWVNTHTCNLLAK